MLSQIPEQRMHWIRWVVSLGWIILILSLLYDPFSAHWTAPDSHINLFRDPLIASATDPESCIKVQAVCLSETPYQVGARIFWSMVIPSSIMIVLVFGHETWRRICPLYFLSQLPRAIGLKPFLKIKKNQWLLQNHFYLQFVLFFIGLNFRILLINSDRWALALFLILTILSATATILLYGGRSWCHYVCPFGMVQTVFTGPRGLLGSNAHLASPKTLTQSMCRTPDQSTGTDKSACVGCKATCMDIDSEKSYWQQLHQPGRRLVQYGYLGLVLGYFIYPWLYSGNFAYNFSGVWTHEPSQVATLLNPGFYLFHTPIPIPKFIAAPMTLAAFIGLSCSVCSRLERFYRGSLRQTQPSLSKEQAIHRVFSICTFISFNIFFIYGGRSEINRLPLIFQFVFQGSVVLVSTLWLAKTWSRTNIQYTRERSMGKFRHQLQKLPLDISSLLDGRSWDDLSPDEVYVLAKVIPGATSQERLDLYSRVLKEAMNAEECPQLKNIEALQQILQILGIKEEEHHQVMRQISGDKLCHLSDKERQYSQGQSAHHRILRYPAFSKRVCPSSDSKKLA
ncbi:MAG: 4Fe-4S binding protein [Leptolyngbya sp. SIO3F4]|nr:4Fe-4S binding protein [Leptolyngbya sp. SIO3F4]